MCFRKINQAQVWKLDWRWGEPRSREDIRGGGRGGGRELQWSGPETVTLFKQDVGNGGEEAGMHGACSDVQSVGLAGRFNMRFLPERQVRGGSTRGGAGALPLQGPRASLGHWGSLLDDLSREGEYHSFLVSLKLPRYPGQNHIKTCCVHVA